MEELLKNHMAMVCLALARFDLELANGLTRPVPWEVELRRCLQDEARRLIAEAGGR